MKVNYGKITFNVIDAVAYAEKFLGGG